MKKREPASEAEIEARVDESHERYRERETREQYLARINTPKHEPNAKGKRKLSQVGDTSTGVLACPKCGSIQFTAKRSLGGKLMAGLLAPKSRVKCVVCGTEYRRGV